jgi:NAD(P)H-flavin reductase
MDSWFPVPAEIQQIRQENMNTFTARVKILDDEIRRQYQWQPGQFNMLYVPGLGEAAISISSDSEQAGPLEHTIRAAGSVTRKIVQADEGTVIGLRGPFGQGWPLEEIDGHDVVLVAGGIGLAPLRPMVYWVLNHRERFGRVMLLFGCRSPDDQIFKQELLDWEDNSEIDCLMTVDNATDGWVGPVGVVTNLLQRIRLNSENAVVMVCGPRILNRVAAWNFVQLQVPDEQIYVSLERNMNCGFGRCGHCQYGSKFVCKDGPVFRFSDISDIFGKEEI